MAGSLENRGKLRELIDKFQIADFSKQLNLEELYLYIFEVWESTEKMLERLSYDELKRKIPKERKKRILRIVECSKRQ